VGLKTSRIAASAFLAITFALSAFGAARLRLADTALGPISVNVGANGPTLIVNASNVGDSSLNLTATSDVTWLVPTVHPQTDCGLTGGNCIPISMALNTSSLAKGMYTGTITVSDPNAIDAPQRITVTVQVGGGVPDQMTFFVPNTGKEVTQSFVTNSVVQTSATSPASGPKVAVALRNQGSFDVTRTYDVTVSAASSVAAGAYNGSVGVSGSNVSGENKTVPLAITVTSDPIASVVSSAAFRIAQGAAAQTLPVVVSNLGSGTIAISDAKVTTTSGGTWLTATSNGSVVTLSADPATLSPGTYQGQVAITTNAANSVQTVPVTLTVLASGPPAATANGVVNNATFAPGEFLAQGDIPAVFGEQFTTGTPVGASTVPLTTTLGGATVYVNNVAVPLYYVSANQINFQIPFEAQVGDAVLRVDRDGQRGNDVYLHITKSQPKLLVAVNGANQAVAAPFSPSVTPVKRGDVVVIYALGLGPTTPAVATGTASPGAPGLAKVTPTPDMFFGQGGLFNPNVSTTPDFVGLTPTFVGLYQVNVTIPQNAPLGDQVPVYLQGDIGTSNQLLFHIVQ